MFRLSLLLIQSFLFELLNLIVIFNLTGALTCRTNTFQYGRGAVVTLICGNKDQAVLLYGVEIYFKFDVLLNVFNCLIKLCQFERKRKIKPNKFSLFYFIVWCWNLIYEFKIVI